VLLGLGLPAAFIALQVLCCVLAVLAARRLGRVKAARLPVLVTAR
jgi:hypothetical protein